MLRLTALFIILTTVSCTGSTQSPLLIDMDSAKFKIENEVGKDLESRFNPPAGFERQHVDSSSFAYYLRHLPLKPAGTKVKYFNREAKQNEVFSAVVDMSIGEKNLQQCADAIMRLRAEYFFSRKEFHNISFTLTNGFPADYEKWIQGYRVDVQGNKTVWRKEKPPSNTYTDFLAYMEFIFTYAGTLSLSKTLQSKDLQNLAIGDVFIIGGSPGHAVIVVDVAENKKSEKIFMLAQSYMPAQDIHVLKNLENTGLSPWYSNNFEGKLHTPEWSFEKENFKTW